MDLGRARDDGGGLMAGLRTLVFDVNDLAAAKRFYAQVLGQPPYFDQPFYVGFDVGGYELGLRPAEGARGPGAGGATAYLDAEDVDAAVARFVALGGRVREAAEDVGGGVRTASVVDPFGNVLGFVHNPGFAPALVAASAGDLSPRLIHHEVTVARPRAAVWKQWTKVEGLRFAVDEAKVDLRPGGLYEWYFLLDNPPGSRGGEGCRVLSFLPERMLSFTWNAPPELARTRKAHTWVVVCFDDEGAGTRVTLDHLGWPARGLVDEPQWEETFAYFQRAWGVVMKRLVAPAP
jgi:predicted enzyme related to lactoylglutathione lyase/uncharacterized protein YndB with AHSA1/START domain